MNKQRLFLLAAAVFLVVTLLAAVWNLPPIVRSDETATTTTAFRKVDVNTADQAALTAVPGITPEMAAAIIAKRDRIGRYDNLYQLEDIDGMTKRKWEDITDYLTVLQETT